jgi:lipopolysaccharide export LptBFGC system permease protein LptF
MPWTIWRWLLIEQLKWVAASTVVTIGLASLGLSLMTLGQGLLGAGEAMRLMVAVAVTISPLVIPISAALGAAWALHQLGQQQQLAACEWLGVAPTRLMAPSAAIGLALGAAGWQLSNDWIPRFARQAADFVAPDPLRLLERRVAQGRSTRVGPWQMTAKSAAFDEAGGGQALELDGLVAVRIDEGGKLIEEASAGLGRLTLQPRLGGLSVGFELRQVRHVDHAASRSIESARWQLPNWNVPAVEARIEAYTATELRAMAKEPTLHPRVGTAAGPIVGLRNAAVQRARWLAERGKLYPALRQMSDDSRWTLEGFSAQAEGEAVKLRAQAGGGWIRQVKEGRVTRQIQAPEATVSWTPDRAGGEPAIRLEIAPTLRLDDTPADQKRVLVYTDMTMAEPPRQPPTQAQELLAWAGVRTDEATQRDRRSMARAMRIAELQIELERWRRAALAAAAATALAAAAATAMRWQHAGRITVTIAVFGPVLTAVLWIDAAGSLIRPAGFGAAAGAAALLAGPAMLAIGAAAVGRRIGTGRR